MAVTRRYLCDCGHEWTKLHFDRADPVPECPSCEVRGEASAPAEIPGTFAITGDRSRAIDFAQKMAEEDYGLTDMNDNMREGDVAAKGPRPAQTAEVEAAVMQLKEAVPELSGEQAEMTKNFWMKGPQQGSPEMAALASTAMANAGPTRESGSDPLALLHQGQKAAGGGMKLDVIGRSGGK